MLPTQLMNVRHESYRGSSRELTAVLFPQRLGLVGSSQCKLRTQVGLLHRFPALRHRAESFARLSQVRAGPLRFGSEPHGMTPRHLWPVSNLTSGRVMLR